MAAAGDRMTATSLFALLLAGQLQATPPVVVPAPPPAPAPTPRLHPPIRARAQLVAYFSDDDYPVEALRNDEQGVVGFRLAIAADGHVESCVVTASSGSPSLDETTCRVLRARARYAPARDAEGRPVPDTDSGRVRWELPAEVAVHAVPLVPVASLIRPGDYPPAARRARAQGTVHILVTVNPAGRVADCSIFMSSGSRALDAATCPIVRLRARYTPARDGAGAVAGDDLMETIVWALPRAAAPVRRRVPARRRAH